MRLPTRLECSAAAVDPGGQLECGLLVYNATDRVDEITVAAQGPLAEWVVAVPPTLALLPETEGRIDVRVELAADAQVEAGVHPVLLEVASGLEDVEPSLEELDVEVGRRTRVGVAVHAQATDATAAGGPAYVASVDSASNHPLRLVVDVSTDVGDDVGVEPRVLDVPAFGHASSVLRLRRRHPDGKPVRSTMTVRGDGVELTQPVVWPALADGDATDAIVVDEPTYDDEGEQPSQRFPVAPVVLLLVLLLAAAIGVWALTRNGGNGPVEVPPPEVVPAFDLSGFPPLRFRDPRPDARIWERTWQLMLQRRGYDVGENGADGRFGPDTDAATREFEAQEDLPVDGVVGDEEWVDMLTHYWRQEDPAALEGWSAAARAQVQEAWE